MRVRAKRWCQVCGRVGRNTLPPPNMVIAEWISCCLPCQSEATVWSLSYVLPARVGQKSLLP